ncbi:phage tail sheath subtilisin-like domain-containing protein [Parvibaculum sp.]|uniref:phage tail sheath subtilisin-like domain-containing protein n=1 Tax=Parvibaculum sp. TaxID=2024848 RepID=UPI002732EA32|nr:phage tail sheath subtilisin-like domain-containing protein [Parvibaculum sp.]MDP3327865.1 phage tail sheath subtilisin-like domain-containing protein [Parvibaculum sp.]
MVPFDTIDPSWRPPLFYIEVGVTGTFSQERRSLLVGQMLDAGTAVADTPIQVSSVAQAKALFGAGSILAEMMEIYRRNDIAGEVWCLPLDDDGDAVAATGTITFGGPATARGTLSIWIGGQRLRVAVAAGDAAAAIAAAVAAAINAATNLPVTAAAEAAVVTVTAKQAGLLGNDIDLRMNYRGAAGGEETPSGVTVAIVAMANGATNPDITDALAALGDAEYDYVACPYTDTDNLDAVKQAWDGITGRWSWLRQIYGHVFSAKRATVAALGTFGNGRNDPHVSVMGYNKSPSTPWAWCSALCARAAVALFAHPARPLQTLPLVGILAPAEADRFTKQERNTLLYDGIATWYAQRDGTVTIERAITTYQLNAFGQADNAWLDVQTPATIWNVVRRLRFFVTTKYARHMLVDDGTRLGFGTPAVSPADIRRDEIAEYEKMATEGLVENVEAFAQNLIVERDANDPTRVNMLYKPDLVNQLRIFAVHADFQLQYPQAA